MSKKMMEKKTGGPEMVLTTHLSVTLTTGVKLGMTWGKIFNVITLYKTLILVDRINI